MRSLMRLVALVAVVTSVLAVAAPHARGGSIIDGNKLWKQCQDSPTSNIAWGFFAWGFCAGYSAAIYDALDKSPVDGFRRCAQAGVTVQQVMDVVHKWLEANPQHRHLTASGLVAAALSKAFPCR